MRNFISNEGTGARMWCANCQADVAAEVSVDHQRIRCASCGSDLGESNVSRLSATTRNAREILERWSKGGVDDPFAPPKEPVSSILESDAPSASNESSLDTIPISEFNAEPTHDPQQHVVDPASPNFSSALSLHEPEPTPSDARVSIFPPSETSGTQSSGSPKVGAVSPSQSTVAEPKRESTPIENRSFRIDEPASSPSLPPSSEYTGSFASHQAEASGFDARVRSDAPQAVQSPHFEVQQAIRKNERKDNWGSLAGQWLAYLGVLGLTLGTCIVVYGHFGEQPVYTPTGWLVMTFGQMLLFLGIISLVSGGMEQTSNEVAQRVEELGEQLQRLENIARFHRGEEVMLRGDDAHSGPSGPHFQPADSPARRERHTVQHERNT